MTSHTGIKRQLSEDEPLARQPTPKRVKAITNLIDLYDKDDETILSTVDRLLCRWDSFRKVVLASDGHSWNMNNLLIIQGTGSKGGALLTWQNIIKKFTVHTPRQSWQYAAVILCGPWSFAQQTLPELTRLLSERCRGLDQPHIWNSVLDHICLYVTHAPLDVLTHYMVNIHQAISWDVWKYCSQPASQQQPDWCNTVVGKCFLDLWLCMYQANQQRPVDTRVSISMFYVHNLERLLQVTPARMRKYIFMVKPEAKAIYVQQQAQQQQAQQQRNVINTLSSGISADNMDNPAVLRNIQQIISGQRPLHAQLRIKRRESELGSTPNDPNSRVINEGDGMQILASVIGQVQMMDVSVLRLPLKVIFENEEGVDEGGLKREFFQLMTDIWFNPNYGMFQYNDQTRLHNFAYNPFADYQESELVGILMGLAIYNNVLLQLRFPRFMYKNLLAPDYQPTLEDLQDVDPELAQGMRHLLTYEGDVAEDYMQTFTVEVESFGHKQAVELLPGGTEIPVTSANRQQYVDLRVQFMLKTSIQSQLTAIRYGFQQVISQELMSLLTAEELELILCGTPDIDFNQIQQRSSYETYTRQSPQIEFFWEVLAEFDTEQQKKLLRYCTGTDRISINGTGFVISRMGGSLDQLPTAHTCFNHILLPPYESKDVLRQKLLIAIEHCQGFDLR